MVRLLAERSDTKFNVKLGGFRFQLQVSYMSSHTEELWYNEILCLWTTIYIICKYIKQVWTLFCTHLNGFKHCYMTITIYLFAHSLFYLTHRQDPFRCYQSRPGGDGNERVIRKIQIPIFYPNPHGWSWINVVSRKLVGEGLPLCRDAVCVFYSPSRLGKI